MTKERLKEALERISGVSDIVGASRSIYTSEMGVWSRGGKVHHIPLRKVPEVLQEDFLGMCDEDSLVLFFE